MVYQFYWTDSDDSAAWSDSESDNEEFINNSQSKLDEFHNNSLDDVLDLYYDIKDNYEFYLFDIRSTDFIQFCSKVLKVSNEDFDIVNNNEYNIFKSEYRNVLDNCLNIINEYFSKYNYFVSSSIWNSFVFTYKRT